jgi:hypothetical protein
MATRCTQPWWDEKIIRMTQTLGAEFADAVAAKDHDRVRALLHDDIDFRAMTPSRVWDAAGPDDILSAIGTWFGDGDVIERLVAVETDSFADRERVGYRLQIRNDDGLHLVEQQAYLAERDGQIGWLRIMCAGYRPISG